MHKWEDRRNEYLDLASESCVMSHTQLSHDALADLGNHVQQFIIKELLLH